ncbi:serine palmitoyltransferase [Nematocida sp. LUAm3]|nr:serine palmitoyltransferase [Nematocida sp. LUAm3]KAI5178154.1 serine palmitoyltransferase [Nematocida sp. LUAm1]
MKDPYQNNPLRIVIEIVLLGLVIRYGFSWTHHKKENEIVLSATESEQLIQEWMPKEMGEEEEEDLEEKTRYILSSFNSFMFGGSVMNEESFPLPELPGESPERREEKKNGAKDIVSHYGVGTCGPRGFYGTVDLQLDLEELLANCLGVEEVVLYAHALLAITSVIKCFCKRGDVVLYDKRSSIGIRRGIYSAKCSAISYSSVKDLEEKLSMEKTKRKFIITEGIFEETGETVDLGAIIRAKRRSNSFLILDDSISFPMLGSKGAVGFFGADSSEIDLWIGSLSGGICSSGGFCGGSKVNCEQQRLSSLAYCFSASLPSVLAYYAMENIKDVLEWEKGADLRIEATEEDSESEYTYTHALELEYPIQREKETPKFFKRVKRERNDLINEISTFSAKKAINTAARRKGTSIRAKNDKFTSIVKVYIQEDIEETEEIIRGAHRAMKRKGIYTRICKYPAPGIMFVVDNSISKGVAEEIGKCIYNEIEAVYLNVCKE